MTSPSIRYVSRSEIDVQQWDRCIDEAPNGLIYAYSFYLDRMSKQWDALVLEDYKMVMPLTWNRKAGIHYLYQPAFTPSLGIFGNETGEETIANFIQSIPGKFGFIEINLNCGNELQSMPVENIEYMLRKNFILPLNRSYDQLSGDYSENIRRNIKKSISLGCRIEKNIAIDQVIRIAREHFDPITNLRTEDYQNFASLFEVLRANNKAVTYGILLNNELLSSAVFFFSHHRAYYILVGNHPNGKTMGTSHYLVDRFIADHAGKDLTLDFEGSDISSLAFFYKSFGAQEEPYPAIKWNRLPWYAKWLK